VDSVAPVLETRLTAGRSLWNRRVRPDSDPKEDSGLADRFQLVTVALTTAGSHDTVPGPWNRFQIRGSAFVSHTVARQRGE